MRMRYLTRPITRIIVLLQSMLMTEEDKVEEDDTDYDAIDRFWEWSEKVAIVITIWGLIYVIAQIARWWFWIH